MPDFDYVQGMAEEYGMGDPDFDVHDPACHSTGGSSFAASPVSRRLHVAVTKTCRACGMNGLRWAQSTSGWRLHAGGQLHECTAYKDAP